MENHQATARVFSATGSCRSGNGDSGSCKRHPAAGFDGVRKTFHVSGGGVVVRGIGLFRGGLEGGERERYRGAVPRRYVPVDGKMLVKITSLAWAGRFRFGVGGGRRIYRAAESRGTRWRMRSKVEESAGRPVHARRG